MGILDQLKVSRRHALKGILSGVGISLWLPVLDVMCNDHGTAFAEGSPFPTTFGIFFWGNGVHPGPLWTPDATGDGDAWKLPTNLEDFAGLKGDMTLVTGLEMLDGTFRGHGWGVVYVLAGGDGTLCNTTLELQEKSPYANLPETSAGTQWMPTIDQLVADAIHTTEPLKSLETGILKYTGFNMGTVSLNLAHTAPNKPLPPERDPATLFNRLFGAGAPPSVGGTPIDVSKKLRQSVLDAVLADLKQLQTSVGATDSRRLDAHMESIRALETRIAMGAAPPPPAVGCRVPMPPTAQAANVDLTKVTETSAAMNQLIAAALSCNMTRVYSHLWSGARDDNHYPIINVDTEHHTLTHGGVDQQERAASIEKYIMSQYAHLAQTLKETPMGASNLLENTVIYGISELAEPSAHIMRNYHIVLMGHAGGRIKGNRHVRKPGRKVTELMLTLQQVMGMNVTTFGSWNRTSTTLPDILV